MPIDLSSALSKEVRRFVVLDMATNYFAWNKSEGNDVSTEAAKIKASKIISTEMDLGHLTATDMDTFVELAKEADQGAIPVDVIQSSFLKDKLTSQQLDFVVTLMTQLVGQGTPREERVMQSFIDSLNECRKQANVVIDLLLPTIRQTVTEVKQEYKAFDDAFVARYLNGLAANTDAQ